jgi:DNA polymerase-2
MPRIGLHTQVAEVDFASMYPTIMAIHNISPETVNCPCCTGAVARGQLPVANGQWSVASSLLIGEPCLPSTLASNPENLGAESGEAERLILHRRGIGDSDVWATALPSTNRGRFKTRPYDSRPSPHPPVPEAGYHLCHQREGLVPKTLKPVLALREQLKARAKELPLEEAAPYKQRQTALKWMLVTCFGYLGYKNARFGKIEAHESVTAYGRDKLLTAKETFEAAGFTVLHGLTDCLWVQKPGGASRRGGPVCPPLSGQAQGFAPATDNSASLHAAQYEAELEDLCAQVFRVTGVKLALEGVYRWIYFMASKQDPQRPVATRYFGVFADGSLKVRGLMCRRRDTPPFVRRAQEAMLTKMAQAATPGELAALRPELEDMAEGFRQRLREGGINPQELVITRVLSQPVADYKVDTPTALAARQLEAAGIPIQPGEKVRYVHREGKRGPKECRVQAAPFLETLEGYDTKIYLELLERAVAEVMLIFNSETYAQGKFD